VTRRDKEDGPGRNGDSVGKCRISGARQAERQHRARQVANNDVALFIDEHHAIPRHRTTASHPTTV
jgi:transcriptional regulator of NAD metabolism